MEELLLLWLGSFRSWTCLSCKSPLWNEACEVVRKGNKWNSQSQVSFGTLDAFADGMQWREGWGEAPGHTFLVDWCKRRPFSLEGTTLQFCSRNDWKIDYESGTQTPKHLVDWRLNPQDACWLMSCIWVQWLIKTALENYFYQLLFIRTDLLYANWLNAWSDWTALSESLEIHSSSQNGEGTSLFHGDY